MLHIHTAARLYLASHCFRHRSKRGPMSATSMPVLSKSRSTAQQRYTTHTSNVPCLNCATMRCCIRQAKCGPHCTNHGSTHALPTSSSSAIPYHACCSGRCTRLHDVWMDTSEAQHIDLRAAQQPRCMGHIADGIPMPLNDEYPTCLSYKHPQQRADPTGIG